MKNWNSSNGFNLAKVLTATAVVGGNVSGCTTIVGAHMYDPNLQREVVLTQKERFGVTSFQERDARTGELVAYGTTPFGDRTQSSATYVCPQMNTQTISTSSSSSSGKTTGGFIQWQKGGGTSSSYDSTTTYSGCRDAQLVITRKALQPISERPADLPNQKPADEVPHF